MSAKVQWPAVRAGALVSIGLCLPIAVLGKVLIDDPEHSAATPVVFVLILLGFAVGGFAAAKRTIESPYTSAGVSALLSFVLIEAAAIISLVIRDKDVRVTLIVSNGLFAYASGLLGAALVARQRTS